MSLTQTSEAQYLSARKALWIELGVVLPFLFLPAVWGAIVSFGATYRYAADVYLRTEVFFALRLLPIVFWLVWQSGTPWSEIGIRKFRLRDVLIGLLTGAALFGLGLAFTFALKTLSPDWYEWGRMLRDGNRPIPKGAGDAVLLSFSFLLRSLALEIVARGYLLQRFRLIFDADLPAVVLTALVAAAWGISLGPAIVTYLLAGLLLGLVRIKSGSVWPCVVATFAYYLAATFVGHIHR